MLSLCVTAAEKEPKAPKTPPPDQKILQNPDAQPEVNIVPGSHGRIQEYRIHGQLYMIKVSPKKGYPYYLIDSDGDGDMDRRRELAPQGWIPSWVLKKW